VRTRDDAGSATVQALVLAGVLVVVTLFAASLGGMLVAQRRAAAAADLAALAAAENLIPGGGQQPLVDRDPCDAAGRIGRSNGARVTECVVEGTEVTVEVAVDARTLLGRTWQVQEQARAGPVSGYD